MKTHYFQSRLLILKFAILSGIFIVLARLFYLQVSSHKKLTSTAGKEVERTILENSPRGLIFDINSNILSTSVKAWDCYILKKYFKSAKKLPEVSRVLNIPQNVLADKYKNFYAYVPIKRNADAAFFEKVKKLKIRGLQCDEKYRRHYPNNEMIRNILGVVNSKNEGISGIELIFNQLLRGGKRKRGILRDAHGRIIYAQSSREKSKPLNIFLTLDKNIQYFCDSILKKFVKKMKADMGMVLVQNPQNGFIYAASSYPMDINQIPVFQWIYEPGSTFKTITLSAALETKTVTPQDKFYCENGRWQFTPKIAIHDHEPEKTLTVSEIIEKSSNIGCAKIGIKLGMEKLYRQIKLFGFGAETGIGFYGESGGILKPMKKYRRIDLAVMSYGHAIAVTPIQMINAYSAIANGGNLYEPKIIYKITDSEKKSVYEARKILIRKLLQKETAEKVKDILVKVVEKGTGIKAQIEGYSIAGKTGTSKKIDEKGNYLTNINVTSFVGFFPAENPRYTILVILDHPRKYYYASETAAPAFREIAKKIIVLKGITKSRKS